MSDPIVTIDHLHKVYYPFPRAMRLLLRTSVTEPVVALDDVSFQVMPGEMLSVLGPNGAGKSTLFRVLTGLTTPTQGSATIMGYDATRQSFEVRRVVGFMPAENRTLLLRHSSRENLAFHGRLQGIGEPELSERIDETLDLVGLFDARDRVGFALSSGMLARLLLARAILHRPAVLILDEPTGAVDPLGAFELLGLIQQIATESQMAVLISSHRLDEVEAINDKVLLLNRGRVVYAGSLGGMSSKARAPRVEIVFISPEGARSAAVLVKGLDGVIDVAVDEGTVIATTQRTVADIARALDGETQQIASIGQVSPRLRDVMAELLGRSPVKRGIEHDH
jgi:ABC-2 type transport system ATP-binding protein